MRTRFKLYLLSAAVLLIAVAIYIRNNYVLVTGDSMSPTYKHGELVPVDYNARVFTRGAVVVVRHGGRTYIKRVYALAGDEFQVVVDDDLDRTVLAVKLLRKQTALRLPPGKRLSRLKVQPGMVYLLGDNLNNSVDSRELGQIPLKEIKALVEPRDPPESFPPCPPTIVLVSVEKD